MTTLFQIVFAQMDGAASVDFTDTFALLKLPSHSVIKITYSAKQDFNFSLLRIEKKNPFRKITFLRVFDCERFFVQRRPSKKVEDMCARR